MGLCRIGLDCEATQLPRYPGSFDTQVEGKGKGKGKVISSEAEDTEV